MDIVTIIDDALASLFSPLFRVLVWACFSAAFSMWVYAKISPQQKIRDVKEAQKESRRALLTHEGNFTEMNVLIRKDLSLSFRQVGLAVVPFIVSLLPLLWLMFQLLERYTAPLVDFGPEWMQGFDFWYIAVLLIISFMIKILFKIA